MPLALFSRYRDNIYLICVNMGPALLAHVRFVTSVFLRIVYGIPLKWEPHDGAVTWGEAIIKPVLRLNGVFLTCSSHKELTSHIPVGLSGTNGCPHRPPMHA